MSVESRSHYRWTPEEIEQLRDGWGNLKGGVPTLAKKLGRSEAGVLRMAFLQGLGPWLNAGEYVTLNMLFTAIVGRENSSYTYMRWLRMGLPTVSRRNRRTEFRMVKISSFWKWAKAHQRQLDFTNFEPGILGEEPAWAVEKRARDRENRRLVHPGKCRWTHWEDAMLREMCERGATWAEIDGTFQRSSDAIRRRIYDLALPHPRRAKGNRFSNVWSAEETDAVTRLSREGYSIDVISRRLGKSSQSVRGMLERQRKCRI